MKKKILLFMSIILSIIFFVGCGFKETAETKNPENENVESITQVTSVSTVSEVEEETEEEISQNLIERFQGDWNGAMIFTDCTGKYEYLQDEWTSCLARFIIDEKGNITPFLGVYVEDTPFTNLQAWLDMDMECMMLNGELAVLKEVLPWMKTETDYGMPMRMVPKHGILQPGMV